MGREIRRVPPDWEHPKDEQGHYIPLYNEGQKAALRQWFAEFEQWEKGEHPNQRDYPFWEWAGIIDPKAHRPDWPEGSATHYQIYETVSEGTPVSPVFSSLATLESWLITQGYSPAAAHGFVTTGWAPSMVIEMYDLDGQEPKAERLAQNFRR